MNNVQMKYARSNKCGHTFGKVYTGEIVQEYDKKRFHHVDDFGTHRRTDVKLFIEIK